MRVPSHIELILSEKPEVVAKEPSKPNVTQFKRKTAAREDASQPSSLLKTPLLPAVHTLSSRTRWTW